MARKLRIGFGRPSRLTADAASYAYEGVSADLEKNTPTRTLPADAQAFTVTGVAAALNKTTVSGNPYSMPAVRGTYAVTGRDATLTPVFGTLTTITTLSITSTSGGALLPFTVGHAFKKADIPTGTYVTANIPDIQVDVQNRWPDGSVKIAMITGRRTLTANVASSITLQRTGAPPSGTAPTLPQLRAVVVGTNTLVLPGYGTVDITALVNTTPFRTRATGPQMSEWHWRAPVGSDAHLVAWFYVRYYAGGAVEIETVVENGYLRVASPGTKTYSASLNLNGTQRIAAASQSVTQYHHTRWSRVDWYGTDPAITPAHNLVYLKSTKLVPNVPAATPSSAAWTGITNWSGTLAAPATSANTPSVFGIGNHSSNIGGPGSSAAIGLLPTWEMLYLASGDKRAYDVTLFNARLFGKYPIHYRDEDTQQPVRMTQKPLLALDSGAPGNQGWYYNYWGQAAGVNTVVGATGTIPTEQVVDGEHQPSAPYLPYLLTARFPFIEECQFAASASLLQKGTIRGGALCLYAGYNNNSGDSGRILGWTFRQAAWSATVTPDSDTAMQTEFRTIVDNNVSFRLSYMTSGPAANNLGLIALAAAENRKSGYVVEKPWMQAFAAVSFAQAYDNEINLTTGSRATHASLLTQVYKCSVGLHGTTGGFNFRRAGMYYFCAMTGGTPSSPSFGPDEGATPLADYGAVYTASMAVLNSGNTAFPALGFTDGGSLSDMPLGVYGGAGVYELPITTSGLLASSFSAQSALPLAYAVDHGAAGATAAYLRYTGSSSWSSYSGEFADKPVWSIAPRTSALPSWVPAAGTWAQVSLNTVNAAIKGDFPPRFLSSRSISAKCENYSGAIWNPYLGTLGAWVFWGGGHSATDLGNEIYIWSADTQLWSRVTDPTYPGSVAVSPNWVSGDVNSAYDEPLRTYGELTAGVPAASHSRWNPCILPPGNGIGASGAFAVPFQSAFHIGGNTQSAQAHIYDFAAGTWSRKGNVDNTQIGGWTSCADTNGNLWRACHPGSPGNSRLQKLPAGGATWEIYNPSGWASLINRDGPLCYIPGSNLIAAWRLVSGALRLYLVDAASPSSAVVTATLSGTAPSVPAAGGYGVPVPAMGMTWCEPLGAICGFLEGSKQVWALRRPTNPLTGTWAWTQLTASNSPTPFTASAGDPELYNRFQYAPALRSFVVTRQIGNQEMWAFRPTELA